MHELPPQVCAQGGMFDIGQLGTILLRGQPTVVCKKFEVHPGSLIISTGTCILPKKKIESSSSPLIPQGGSSGINLIHTHLVPPDSITPRDTPEAPRRTSNSRIGTGKNRFVEIWQFSVCLLVARILALRQGSP